MIDHMKRRSFLTGLAAMGVTYGMGASAGAVSAVGSGKQENLKITKVEILQITGNPQDASRRKLVLSIPMSIETLRLRA